MERKFRVTYNGGRYNGAQRYFKTLAGAIISAKSCIRSNADLLGYICCEVESLIFYNGSLVKETLICEFKN